MKKQFIIANWKSHNNVEETKAWLEEFQLSNVSARGGWASGSQYDCEVIICPPFPLLPEVAAYVKTHHATMFVGSQDISSFPEGAYTGAVAAKLLREFVTYSIIGHSERRQYFHENLNDLSEKVMQTLSVGITPVYCVSEKEEKIPAGVKLVAYEPLEAIGSGKPDDPQRTESIARFIKEKNDVSYVLYGGSVTAQNVSQYTSLPSVNGVLVGGASLSAIEFSQIIQHV